MKMRFHRHIHCSYRWFVLYAVVILSIAKFQSICAGKILGLRSSVIPLVTSRCQCSRKQQDNVYFIANNCNYINDNNIMSSTSSSSSSLRKCNQFMYNEKENKGKDHQNMNNYSIHRTVKKDFGYFMKCSIAGAISCSFSHAIMVPIDNIKTKMQVSGELVGMKTRDVTKQLLKRNGWKIFSKGLAATFSGYFMQGIILFIVLPNILPL